MLSQTQSCTMIATTTITIVVVAAQIIAGANSLSEEADNKISTLPGQPTVEFKQYGGYITVDEVQQRALVYYFVEAKVEPASKPVVLWLNGGHYVPQLAQFIAQTKTKLNLKGIAIGNPLLEFNTDFNSRDEFFWSHGLISDSTYEIFTKVCNFSQIRRQYQTGTLTAICAGVNRLVSTEVSKYIDSYDVTLDVCLPSEEQ